MSRKRKERKQLEGIDYWKSSSDLMTALILVLLLVIMFLILYILEMPDKEFDKELKYDEITEEQDANGENLKTSDKTSFKETDNDGGEKEGQGKNDDDDNGNGNGNGNGNDDGTGKDDPGEGDGSKSAVLASLVDGETGKAIPAKDVTFELYSDSKALTVLNTYYPVKKSYRTFKTTENGTFYLPEKVLATSYYFHQLSDFKGYDVADKVEFTIDGAYDWPDPFLVKIPMYPLRDVVRIQMIDQDNGQAVAGGKFNVIAEEDIKTLDDTIRVKKGDVAGTITCDEKGYGESNRLYLGKYKVVQTDIPDYYASNEEAINVTLRDSVSGGASQDESEKSKDGADQKKDAAQNAAGTSDDEEVIDYNTLNTVRAERTRITFILRDELTGDAVSGAVYDVSGPNINQQMTTDEGGQIVLDEVVKNGTYEFSEVSAPADYIAAVEPVKVKVSAKGRIGNDAKADVEATNRVLRLDVGVRDAILRTHLLDTKAELFTAGGKSVETWTTNGSFHEITGLEQGKYYVNLNGDASKKYNVTVTDTAEIQTLNINLFTTRSYVAIGAAAVVLALILFGIGALIRRTRKRRKEEEKAKAAATSADADSGSENENAEGNVKDAETNQED